MDGNELVISAVLPSEFNGKIYEIGLYSSVVNISSEGFDDKLLVNFDEAWTDLNGDPLSTSLYSSNSRLGTRSLDTSNTSIYAQSNAAIDISGYSNLDNLSILYNVSTVGSGRAITITFEDGQLPSPGSKTITLTLPGDSAGFKVFTTPLGNLIDSNFNNTISKIIISASSDPTSAEIEIDSIRINDADETDPLFALVSRSLIGSVGGDSSSDYITKNAGIEVDIEYRVRIT